MRLDDGLGNRGERSSFGGPVPSPPEVFLDLANELADASADRLVLVIGSDRVVELFRSFGRSGLAIRTIAFWRTSKHAWLLHRQLFLQTPNLRTWKLLQPAEHRDCEAFVVTSEECVHVDVRPELIGDDLRMAFRVEEV